MRWFDALKCVPLSASRATWLSLGGEVRGACEYTHHPLWGRTLKTSMVSFSSRYILHSDLHLGRTYCACSGSSMAPWRTDAPDHRVQARRIGSICNGASSICRRCSGRCRGHAAGRAAGAALRLGTARRRARGPNVRRKFDGGRVRIAAGGWQVDGIAVRPTRIAPGVFDDDINDAQALWSAPVGRSPAWLPFGSALDLYYLGYTEKEARFDQGTAQKPGTRWASGSGASGRDGTGTGSSSPSSAASDVRTSAPGASLGDGLHGARAPWSPRLGLSANIASGDLLQPTTTCRPSTRCSHAATTSPNWRCSGRNFFNLHPALTVHPTARLSLCRRGLLLAPGAQRRDLQPERPTAALGPGERRTLCQHRVLAQHDLADRPEPKPHRHLRALLPGRVRQADGAGSRHRLP